MFEGADPDPAKYTKLEEAYEIFDKLLEGQKWAAGDQLSIADFALVATVSSAEVSTRTNSFCSWPTGESKQRCFCHVWCKLDLNLIPE
jgi:glutathione S-transferase